MREGVSVRQRKDENLQRPGSWNKEREEDLVETEAGGMGHEEGRSCASRWSPRWRGREGPQSRVNESRF